MSTSCPECDPVIPFNTTVLTERPRPPKVTDPPSLGLACASTSPPAGLQCSAQSLSP